MPKLSKTSLALPTSGIREISDLAADLDDVIQLAIGEPDTTTPSTITDAAFRAARRGNTRYTPSNGIKPLRELIVDKLRSENSVHVDPSQIIVSPGAAFALSTSIMATVAPGDDVLIPDPCWPNYVSMVMLAGGHPVRYPLAPKEGFLPDVKAIQDRISPKTKLLITNNPGNPTGAVYSPEVVEGLVRLAAEYDLFLLADEVYEKFVFEGDHRASASFGYKDGVISVFSSSKTYAMTGWRLGYTVAPRQVAPVISKLQGALVSCASSVSQKAAEAALSMNHATYTGMRDRYRARRDDLVNVLGDSLVTIPRGAFYGLIDVSRIGRDSYAVARDLLRCERVATAPGETFGEQCAGMLRISLAAAEDDLIEGGRRISRYLSTCDM